MKHVYEIYFNQKTEEIGNSYSFGNTKDINLKVKMQCAALRFKSGKLYTIDDFITFKNKLFRDAYRKIHLIHMVSQGTGLNVQSIIFVIDGVMQVINRENDPNGHFPYMFPMKMIKNNNMGSDWKCLENPILHSTKTAIEEELPFVAMYSFLMSCCREYSIDRFTNLWTAMNAYYCYVRKTFNEWEKSKYDGFTVPQKLLIAEKDSEEKGVISWMIGHQFPEVGKSARIAEIKGLWENDYSVERELQGYDESDIKELYEAAMLKLSGSEISEKFKVLEQRADQFEQELFPFLLIEYPYYWRCKYLHGNRVSTLITAFNDYEMGVLHTINYFLTMFLKTEIPKMFSGDFWDEEKQEDVRKYLRRVRQTEQKDVYQNALNSFLKEIEKGK